MRAPRDIIVRFGQGGLQQAPPPDYLWENLQTILLLPRETQSRLAAVFARLADQVESGDPAIGPAIRRMCAEERRVLVRRLRQWWMVVTRISVAPRFSMRNIIVDLVPKATGLN
jgi:hypothetical protein